MTEQEWLTCDDPQPMIQELIRLSRDPARWDRQVRLFSVACCRLIWDEITEATHREVIDHAEQVSLGIVFADSTKFRNFQRYWWELRVEYARAIVEVAAASPAEGQYYTLQEQSGRRALAVRSYFTQVWGRRRAGPSPPDAAPPTHPWHLAFQAGVEEVNLLMSDYLVCIVGNPFRPAFVFDPSWRTSTTFGLAQAIDAERAYDRLPILADALEEAGCDDASALTHCRGAGHHTRGCWVVEHVLNRHSTG